MDGTHTNQIRQFVDEEDDLSTSALGFSQHSAEALFDVKAALCAREQRRQIKTEELFIQQLL